MACRLMRKHKNRLITQFKITGLRGGEWARMGFNKGRTKKQFGECALSFKRSNYYLSGGKSNV
jgi:hypothetical protein